MSAVLAGFLGVDAGLLWIVCGLWLVRGVWGRAPSLGWGIACLTAGIRWGTIGLGDVQAATRSAGPTLGTGSAAVVAGVSLAFLAALLEESAADGFRSKAIAERAAAGAAVLVLVPAFCAPGAGEPSLPLSLLWWTAAGFALTAITMLARPLARRLPSWAAPLLAAGGALTVGAAL